jgi:hypothetical protein
MEEIIALFLREERNAITNNLIDSFYERHIGK